MDFGFTNDQAQIDAVRAWRDDAVADGWSIQPTYGSEPQDRAARLTKDGFVAQIISRESKPGVRWKFEAKVNVWGPDGLAISVPKAPVYDWQALVAGTRTCSNCGTTDVDTERYSFAGRCCADCLPKMRAAHEKPGWNL